MAARGTRDAKRLDILSYDGRIYRLSGVRSDACFKARFWNGEEMISEYPSRIEKFQDVFITTWKGYSALYNNDVEFTKRLSSTGGFARFIASKVDPTYNSMVIESLGPSLANTFEATCMRRFSRQSIFLIAEQAIERLRALHRKGIVHRNICPDVFIQGAQRDTDDRHKAVFESDQSAGGLSVRGPHPGRGRVLHLVGFSFAAYFTPPPDDGSGRVPKRPAPTPLADGSILNVDDLDQRFTSRAWDEQKQHSFLDDLESLGWMLLYFTLGKRFLLKQDATPSMVRAWKDGYGAGLICSNIGDPVLRRAIQKFIEEVKRAQTEDWRAKPNYISLRNIFRKALKKSGEYKVEWCWSPTGAIAR